MKVCRPWVPPLRDYHSEPKPALKRPKFTIPPFRVCLSRRWLLEGEALALGPTHDHLRTHSAQRADSTATGPCIRVVRVEGMDSRLTRGAVVATPIIFLPRGVFSMTRRRAVFETGPFT